VDRSTARARSRGQRSIVCLGLRAPGEIAMKTITSALVALLLVAGVASTANALDAKSFYEQVDRDHY
jgi:hypothetical protein